MSSVINKKLRGIRDSIPGGYILGRTGSGSGPPVLLPVSTFTTPGYVANTTIQVGGAAGGDLSGTYPNPTVAKIQGNAVKAAVPTDQQVLQWVAANSDWEPTTLSQSLTSPPRLDKIIDRAVLDLLHDGTAFGSGGGGGATLPYLFSPPTAATFPTIINTGSVSPPPSVTDNTIGMLYDSGAHHVASENIRAALKNVINTTMFTITMGIRPTIHLSNFGNVGIILSDGTKYILFDVIYDTQPALRVTRFTNATTYNNNQYNQNGIFVSEIFLQIKADGTNFNFNYSMDGINFVNVWSEGVTAFMSTLTKYGIGTDANGTGDFHSFANVFYWSETNP